MNETLILTLYSPILISTHTFPLFKQPAYITEVPLDVFLKTI